jgi:mRNA degradation ribonuclease J1/J2
MVNRSEAHAIRLALIYALILGHDQIEAQDLTAALSFVDYATKSAFRIFGGATTDKRKARLIDALQKASNGLTMTEIREQVFSKHISSDDLNKLLSEMEESHLVTTDREPTAGAPKRTIKLKCVGAKSVLSVLSNDGGDLKTLKTHKTHSVNGFPANPDDPPDFNLDDNDPPDFDLDDLEAPL